MTFQEALDRFGSDRPDTRFGLEIVDFTDTFAGSGFGVFKRVIEGGGMVRAINAKGFACVTTGQIKRLEEVAKDAGAGGLAAVPAEGRPFGDQIST
jgi:aspartyl-tRNA synthetase